MARKKKNAVQKLQVMENAVEVLIEKKNKNPWSTLRDVLILNAMQFFIIAVTTTIFYHVGVIPSETEEPITLKIFKNLPILGPLPVSSFQEWYRDNPINMTFMVAYFLFIGYFMGWIVALKRGWDSMLTFEKWHPVNYTMLISYILLMSYYFGWLSAVLKEWFLIEAAFVMTAVLIGLTLYTFRIERRGQRIRFRSLFLWVSLSVFFLHLTLQHFSGRNDGLLSFYGFLATIIYWAFILLDVSVKCFNFEYPDVMLSVMLPHAVSGLMLSGSSDYWMILPTVLVCLYICCYKLDLDAYLN